MAKQPDRVQLYLDQWKHNRDFARTIDPPYRDWQVTAVFYTALHLINAVLAKYNIVVERHTERNDEVRFNAVFDVVRNKYLNLFRICSVTRYDAEPDLWIPKNYLTINDLVNDLLTPIEQNLLPKINSTLTTKPLVLKA